MSAQALRDIADMLERRLEMRAKIQSGLVYPALLIVLAIVSTGVVLGTLVPSIAPIFADNGKPMPKGLQFIIDLQGAWPLIPAASSRSAPGCSRLKRYAAANPPLQIKLDRALLDLPYAGDIIAKFQAARFARTLGAMSRAGVPLLQGLESARAVVVQRAFSFRARQPPSNRCAAAARSARALERIDAFPLAAAQMTRIGEEVAKLDELLLRLATMFERQTQRGIERAVGLITPILTILIAAVVGGLVMTVMDAVLGINELAANEPPGAQAHRGARGIFADRDARGARHSRARRRPRHAAGRRPSPRLRVESAARSLCAALRQTRMRAIAANEEMALTVDLRRKTFFSPTVGEKPLPNDAQIDLTVSAIERRSRNKADFAFYPSGGSSGGEMSIALSGVRAQIAVNWLTGATRCAVF